MSLPKKSGGSGEHPAVKVYRAKMQSIADGQLEELSKLDKRIEEFVSSRSSPPAAPEKDDHDSERHD